METHQLIPTHAALPSHLRNEKDWAQLVRQPIGVLPDGLVDTPISFSGSWVSQDVGPPILARWLLRRRPRSSAYCLAGLQHGSEQVRYLRPAGVEQHEVPHA
jgi:hypothetical protein